MLPTRADRAPGRVRLPVPRPVRDRGRLQARAGAVREPAGASPRELERELDLVALATIADVVPLLGENRTLAARGLRRLAATTKPGLRALMAAARVAPAQAGRARGGVRARAAAERRRAPVPRRRGARAAADRAIRCAPSRSPTSSTPPTASAARSSARSASRPKHRWPSSASARPTCSRGEGWHPGVIGIVASRLVEHSGRPGRDGGARRRGRPGLRAQHRRLRPARRPARLLASTCAASAGTARRPGWRSRASTLAAFASALCAHAREVLSAGRPAARRARRRGRAGGGARHGARRGARSRSRPSGAATRPCACCSTGASFADSPADGGRQARALQRQLRAPPARGRWRSAAPGGCRSPTASPCRRPSRSRSTSGTASASRAWCCAAREPPRRRSQPRQRPRHASRAGARGARRAAGARPVRDLSARRALGSG